MTVSYQAPIPVGLTGTEVSPGVAQFTGLTIDAAWEMVYIFTQVAAASGSTSITINSVVFSDGTNTLTLTVPAGGTNFEVLSLPTAQAYGNGVAYGMLSAATPGALSTAAGAVTATVTWSRDSSGAGVLVYGGLNSGSSASDPLRAIAYVSTGDSTAASITHANMAVENGGAAVLTEWSSSGTGFSPTTISPLTERYDATVSSRRYGIATLDIGSDQTIAPVVTPSTTTRIISYLMWFKESNNPNITDVDTLPATQSEALTVTGTALDVANTGIRLRDTADTGNYETLSVSGATATQITATMPAMLTEVPFTVGTSRSVEFIATLSGSPSGLAVAGSVDVAAGWAVVELVSPNTTATESLAGNLPFTPIDLDQIYYNTLSGLVAVGTDGVPVALPGYVANTIFQFYGWDESAGSGRWSGPYEASFNDTGDIVVGGDTYRSTSPIVKAQMISIMEPIMRSVTN